MVKIENNGIFELQTPDNALPVIFDSPHSGKIYPADFNFACDFDDLRHVEDSYVDELFSGAANHNAYFLSALFPRSYIDVNRAIDDIDETLLDRTWPADQFGRIRPTQRSDSGIGLINRLIKPGAPIYTRKLSPNEIMSRIKTYYEPYHDTLCTILDDIYYNHGQFWHINCHSMPNNSAYPKRHITLIGNTPKPSDIVLGDRDGQSCSRDFVHLIQEYWRNLGYRVTINDPFKGVELVSRYSQPTRGKNSIQIEINRALYMNEENGKKSKHFHVIQSQCDDMIRLCGTFAQSKLTNIAAD